jgi:elongation factor Ts
MSTATLISELRKRTGAGILDCKKALAENADDMDKSIDWLRAKGITKAGAKASREATEGAVVSYIHANGRIGVLVEVNCETDFAAMNEKFQNLARDIAMHIAAAAPEWVSIEDVPVAAREHEREVQVARVMEEGKPKNIAEKIVEGRISKWYEDVCLLEQKFVKDDSKTIRDVLTGAVAIIGENIRVRRFVRYELGEGLTKKSNDFAAEVAAQAGLN